MSIPKLEWEVVNEQHRSSSTMAAVVPGGVLYRHVIRPKWDNVPATMSMVFVPSEEFGP